MINVIYRISDKSYDKAKLPGTSKKICLDNFISVFNTEQIMFLVDNCTEDTIAMCAKQVINAIPGFPTVMKSNLGNAGAIRQIIQTICNRDDDEIFYLLEDDYLHLDVTTYLPDDIASSKTRIVAESMFRQLPSLIEEGLERADYVTLYDHPDKYQDEYNNGEITPVWKTKQSHWRQTISTTMTFATKAKTLRDDLDIWLKYTNEHHPQDHHIFSDLLLHKKKRLAVCIPGAACHVDLTYSTYKKKLLIDNWAIQMMENKLRNFIANKINSRIDSFHSTPAAEEMRTTLRQLMDVEASIQKLSILSIMVDKLR